MKARTWLLLGCLCGLIGGLAYLWLFAADAYVSTYPPLMDAQYREDWIRMASIAYALEGNLARTQIRLRDLPTAEIQRILRQTLEESISTNRPLTLIRPLAELASLYQVESPAVAIYTGSAAVEPSPTALPTLPATATPAPTPTRRLPPPTATATVVSTLEQAPYRIISQTLTCSTSPTIAVSLVATHTIEIRGKESTEFLGLAPREVWLTWEGGAERAFTGLRTERGLGYADFAVEKGHIYNLYIDAARGAPVLTIQVEPCPNQEGSWVSRHLVILEHSN